MIHVTEGINSVYLYSTKRDLIDIELKIQGKDIRERTEIVLPLTVLFFGNSFYKLETTIPELNSVEFSYQITSGGDVIDQGLLRYEYS